MIILILSFLVHWHSASAKDNSVSHYAKMKQACFENMNYLSKCELNSEAPSNIRLDFTPIDTPLSKITTAEQAGFIFAKSAVQVVELAFQAIKMKSINPCSSENTSSVCKQDRTLANGFKRLDRIRTELDKVKSKLSNCQKVCLSKCIASTLIAYDEKYSPPQLIGQSSIETAGRNKGVCVQFTSFSNLLSSYMGAPVRGLTNAKDMHRVGGITLNGKDYWFEPQNSDCSFYLIK